MSIRWKGKGAEAEALANPLSKIVSQLKSALIESDSRGRLFGCIVLLEATMEQAELLKRACIGVREKDRQRFELNLEEAFYLSYILKCIKIVDRDKRTKNEEELWKYAISNRVNFPILFKAYCHLRTKNWVVMEGSKYGVDFVAYRNHPALVHSEYAVLVLSKEDNNANDRLRVWSDYHCVLRLCASVAKTLLLLHMDKNGSGTSSPSCVESYLVYETQVRRWNPEKSRESQTTRIAETLDIESIGLQGSLIKEQEHS